MGRPKGSKNYNGDVFSVTCVVCDRTYETGSRTSRTCSNTCRQRLKRWRQEDARNFKQALRTLSTIQSMVTRGISVNGIDRIVEVRDAANLILRDLQNAGFGIPTQLIPNVGIDESQKEYQIA